jgi:hypothetical protein
LQVPANAKLDLLYATENASIQIQIHSIAEQKGLALTHPKITIKGQFVPKTKFAI